MKVAAATAIAGLMGGELDADYIVPSPLDPRVARLSPRRSLPQPGQAAHQGVTDNREVVRHRVALYGSMRGPANFAGPRIGAGLPLLRVTRGEHALIHKMMRWLDGFRAAVQGEPSN
jgi:hypothetical protein